MKNQLIKIPTILFLSILLVLFYLLVIDRDPSKLPSNLLNKNAPEFVADSLLDNEKFLSKKELNNNITIVNFFATWCAPCREEHVYIKRFSSEKKIKVIGINYKDSPEKAIIWLKKLGNPYSNIAIDKKGKIAIDWGVYGIPETFLINSSGIIKYRHAGQITKKIYKKFNLLIKEVN